MASFEDTYKIDTSIATSALGKVTDAIGKISAASGLVEGITGKKFGSIIATTDKLNAAVGKIGGKISAFQQGSEMAGAAIGTIITPETIKGLETFGIKAEQSQKAIGHLSSVATAAAGGFAVGGPWGAGLAAGGQVLWSLGKYAWETTHAVNALSDAQKKAASEMRSAESVRQAFIDGSLTDEEKKLKEIRERVKELMEEKELDLAQQKELTDALTEEKEAQDAVTKAATERAKAQQAINDALAEEKKAMEELRSLRDAPTKAESEAAKRIREYLEVDQQRMADLIQSLEESSPTKVVAKRKLEEILSGRGSSAITQAKAVATEAGAGYASMLADLQAAQRNQVLPSTQTLRIPSASENAFNQKLAAADAMAAQVQDASGDAGKLGALYQELSQKLSDAKRDRDILMQTAITSLQDSVFEELQKTAQVRATIMQQQQALRQQQAATRQNRGTFARIIP